MTSSFAFPESKLWLFVQRFTYSTKKTRLIRLHNFLIQKRNDVSSSWSSSLEQNEPLQCAIYQYSLRWTIIDYTIHIYNIFKTIKIKSHVCTENKWPSVTPECTLLNINLFNNPISAKNYTNLYILDRKSYISAPWVCFQILNILFRS